MRLIDRICVCSAALAMSAPASAVVLLSNLSEPIRATTTIAYGLWAAQGFVNDGTTSSLVSIRTVLGQGAGMPGAFAELRQGSTTGALLTTFVMPALAGADSVRTLAPVSAVSLMPGETYYLLMGALGTGTFGWSYAEGNASTGPGAFANYEYSTDQGASWANFGADNPYLMEIEVRPSVAVPEPATWLMLIAGFGAVGGAMRRRRVRLRFAR